MISIEDELKASMGEHIDGFTRYEELKWLYEMAQGVETIVELGSWLGRTTYALCKGCKGTVYAVDHFKGSPEHDEILKSGINPLDKFKENMKEFNNLVIVSKASEEAVKDERIPEKVDAVFIDASHLYYDVFEDIKRWYPRCKKIFCGHDLFFDGVPLALFHYFGGIHNTITNKLTINVRTGPVSIWYREILQCIPGEKNL